jgi:hypothetical protein
VAVQRTSTTPSDLARPFAQSTTPSHSRDLRVDDDDDGVVVVAVGGPLTTPSESRSSWSFSSA